MISSPNSFRNVVDCTHEEYDDKNKRDLKVLRKDIRTIEALIFLKIKDGGKRKEPMKKRDTDSDKC